MAKKLATLSALLIVLMLSACAGTAPEGIGVTEGRLAACPGSPNCVTSQAPASDAEHYIAPLAYSGDRQAAMQRLTAAITSLEGSTVINTSANYLHAEFASSLFGFVDDVEFYFPTEKVIHVRSAARLGYSDFGVNRKRIERIRTLLQE